MKDASDDLKEALIRVLLGSKGNTLDVLVGASGEDEASVTVVIDELQREGLVRRSVGGNYYVPRDARARAYALVNEDAPSAWDSAAETLPDLPPRDRPWFFNDTFNLETYRLKLEDAVCGARENYENIVRGMRVGDLILGYLMAPHSEWICILRIARPPWRSGERLHDFDDLPWKVQGEFLAALEPGFGIPRLDAADEAHALGGRAAPYRDAPKRVNPVAAGVIIRRIMEVHRRTGSAVQTVEPGPGLGDAFD